MMITVMIPGAQQRYVTDIISSAVLMMTLVSVFLAAMVYV